MTAHKHLNNMRLFAEDAAETETPWDRWQCRRSEQFEWQALTQPPIWRGDYEYRRTPVSLGSLNGRCIYPGDRLWHEGEQDWFIAKEPSQYGAHRLHNGQGWHPFIDRLSWHKPAHEKTLYQWAYCLDGQWYTTIGFFETEEDAMRDGKHGSNRYRRLDWTSITVLV